MLQSTARSSPGMSELNLLWPCAYPLEPWTQESADREASEASLGPQINCAPTMPRALRLSLRGRQ